MPQVPLLEVAYIAGSRAKIAGSMLPLIRRYEKPKNKRRGSSGRRQIKQTSDFRKSMGCSSAAI